MYSNGVSMNNVPVMVISVSENCHATPQPSHLTSYSWVPLSLTHSPARPKQWNKNENILQLFPLHLVLTNNSIFHRFFTIVSLLSRIKNFMRCVLFCVSEFSYSSAFVWDTAKLVLCLMCLHFSLRVALLFTLHVRWWRGIATTTSSMDCIINFSSVPLFRLKYRNVYYVSGWCLNKSLFSLSFFPSALPGFVFARPPRFPYVTW